MNVVNNKDSSSRDHYDNKTYIRSVHFTEVFDEASLQTSKGLLSIRTALFKVVCADVIRVVLCKRDSIKVVLTAVD